MSNIREQLLAKTACIKATDARKPDATRRAARDRAGMAGALATAQLRVQELEANGTPSQLPVGKLAPNPWRPWRVFNEAKQAELAESIREVRLMQPIVARRVDAGLPDHCGRAQVARPQNAWRGDDPSSGDRLHRSRYGSARAGRKCEPGRPERL